MARVAVLYGLASLLIASGWLRLEKGGVPWEIVGMMIALGLLPTVAVAVGRRWSALGIGVVALFVAAAEAFRIPVTEMRLGGEHDFLGPVVG